MCFCNAKLACSLEPAGRQALKRPMPEQHNELALLACESSDKSLLVSRSSHLVSELGYAKAY